jgi:hypothetical protein
MFTLEANRVTLMRLETAEITDGQRDRRASGERRKESAFNRFEARAPDRSSLRTGDFTAGKITTLPSFQTYTRPIHSYHLGSSRVADARPVLSASSLWFIPGQSLANIRFRQAELSSNS